jgi:hypothetical protein
MPTLSIAPTTYFAARRDAHGSFAVDALIALALLALIAVALIAFVALLGSADPSAAAPAAADGRMLILPP